MPSPRLLVASFLLLASLSLSADDDLVGDGISLFGVEEVEVDPDAPDESAARDKIRDVSDSSPWEVRATGEVATSASSQQTVSKVKPSVVLIRTPNSHGTGFVVDSAGWILTNQHVIKDAPWDPVSRFQIVKVNLGVAKGDGFGLIEKPVWARVYKSSRRLDLALLKLQSLPAEIRELPAIEFAELPPKDGETCYAIGMPAAGVLWTVRIGNIAGHGEFPDALQNILRLGADEGADGDQRRALTRILAPDGNRKVTLSTCGINRGDSGGPLTNRQGQVVAVTFAVPVDAHNKEFAYHIHLDEVKAFLGNSLPVSLDVEPATSLPVPTDWRVSGNSSQRTIDFVVFHRGKDKQLAYYFDADGRPVGDVTPGDIPVLNETEFWKTFGIEWAVTWNGDPTYFFDQNLDGEIDLVFVVTGVVGNQITKFEKTGSGWKVSAATDSFLDDEVVFDKISAQKKFTELRHRILPSPLRR